MGFFNWLFKKIKKERTIKLGLALGSGGAKGYAHLGALKAFEENGIEFDMVAGASIGSIVGAFYCDGYTTTDIEELLKRINYGEIINKLMIKMNTDGMVNVIDREIGYKTIEELKKPYSAVATEIESGDPYIFKSGRVAEATCASSCIPPFFKPVTIGDKRYVDGAFSNSVPSDVVRDMGADYVVGIDLSTRNTKPTLLSKIFPTYQSKVAEPWAKGYEYSDTIMHPDLNAYSSVDFMKGADMMEIGYNCAMEYIPEIKKDIERLKKMKPEKKKKVKTKKDKSGKKDKSDKNTKEQ